MNILEAKLSSEHRNDLPNTEFGLPKERKYPLNDESHVRSAIMFFKYAKPEQRRELAKNINLKLKKFDMQIKVSKSNPFYKYIDKKYLIESSIITESSFTYEKGTNSNKLYDDTIYDIMIKSERFVDEYFILETESRIYNILKSSTDTTGSLIKFIHDINNMFEVIYEHYLNYIRYDTYTDFSNLYYPLINDFRKTFLMKFTPSKECIDISDEQTAYVDFLGKVLKNNYDHNWYYIYRVNFEIYHCIMSELSQNVEFKDSDINVFLPQLIRVPKSIKIDFRVYLKDQLSYMNKSVCFDTVKKILEDKKKQLQSEVYIINKSNMIDEHELTKNTWLYDIKNEAFRNKVEYIGNNWVNINDTLNILRDVTFNITQVDIMRLSKVRYIKRILSGNFSNGDTFWFGIDDSEETIYIIGKVENDDKISYKLLELADHTIKRVVYGDESGLNHKVIKVTFAESNDDIFDTYLTEGLSINENGDIKITINPKKSYMEEYSEAHRILIENYKNKNYEAMKQNVAFMFLLISIIEKDKKYKAREPEIVKARAFAINDFKTYLSYIQKEEPSFNFEKYYRDSEFDKYVVNIPKETILGIRNLLKTIFM